MLISGASNNYGITQWPLRTQKFNNTPVHPGIMKFTVHRYFSGFCTYSVEAENEEEAVLKAKQLPVNHNEVMGTLMDWEEADEARSETS